MANSFKAFSLQSSGRLPLFTCSTSEIILFTARELLAGDGYVMLNVTYTWQHAVQEAIAETDTNQLKRKIELAEVAIFERIETFLATDGSEAIALFDALAKLRALKEVLDG
jgi:hypothetical protein